MPCFPFIKPQAHIIFSPYNHNPSQPNSPPPSAAVIHRSSAARTPLRMAYYTGCEYEDYQPHFLDSCTLCRRPLSHNSDIFMYRGDTPFCSQECREEQIEIDEAAEKRWKVSSSSSKRSNSVRQNKESTKESDTNKAVRTGTVAVA